MDCKTGDVVWFEKNALTNNLEITEASCAVPMMAPIVKYDNFELLDGGIPAPIPIEKSISDGNRFHVIVLTQNNGYTKKPFTKTDKPSKRTTSMGCTLEITKLYITNPNVLVKSATFK